MDTLADPSPVAEALGPQLKSLYESLGNILPSGSTTSALPSYEELIASIQTSSSNDQSDPLRGRLHAARMHASMAYLVLDAIWILMKTRGISLSQHHPINAELERARVYLEKVKKASGNDRRERDAILAAQEGPQRRVEADAAGRFVKAALASQKGTLTKFDDDDQENNVSSSVQDADKLNAIGGPVSSESSPAVPDSKRKKRGMNPYTEYDGEQASPKTKARKDSDGTQGEAGDDEELEEDEDDEVANDSGASERKKRSRKKAKKRKRSKNK